MQMLEFECDICGSVGAVSDMVERHIVGKKRAICTNCHEYLNDAA
jgi:transcription elongation factor Elf1